MGTEAHPYRLVVFHRLRILALAENKIKTGSTKNNQTKGFEEYK
jgi:hypothetical protein